MSSPRTALLASGRLADEPSLGSAVASQSAFPAIGAMYVAGSEHCTFTVSELIEAEQRVIAHALEVAVIGCLFLLAMHLTLGAIDVQDNAPVDCLGYTTFYPFDIQPLKALKVILLSK